MVLPESLGTLLLLAVFGGAIFYFVHRRHRLERVRRTRILAGEAMRRRGITPADAEAAGREHEVFAAVRNCAACRIEDQCREALAGSTSATPPDGCPNSAFFDDVATHKAARTQPGAS